MDKLAQVKLAEVVGALAALVDSGTIKVASEDDFDAISEAVASGLSDNWDFDEVMNKTAEVLQEVEAFYAGQTEESEKTAEAEESEDLDKEAEEFDETAAMAALGELTMAKLAGEISDEEFAKEAGVVGDMLGKAKSVAKTFSPGKISQGYKEYRAASAKLQDLAGKKGLGEHLRKRREWATNRKSRAVKHMAQGAAGAATVGGAAAGSAIGAMKLYKKHAKKG